jgi:CBS-domain-containing membrane protein
MPAVQALALPQMGVNVRQTDDRDWLQHMTVAEVMGTGYTALAETMTVIEAGWAMVKAKRSTILVWDGAQQLTGIVTLADIRRHLPPSSSLADKNLVPPKTLKDICTKEILYTYPNELVEQATERMVARGLQLLPVVNAANPRQILGVLEQSQVNLAADFASTQAALNTYLLAGLQEFPIYR